MTKTDVIEVEILPNGDLKTSADQISMPNHSSAEKFLQILQELTGGPVTRQRKGHTHTHQHEHQHEKAKA